MNHRKHSRIPVLFLGLALLLTACGGENTAATMHLVKTEGMVRVDNAEGKNVKISENLGLYSGYELNTLAESYGWITLDDTKLAKMDASSDVEIRKKDKLLELYVRSGGLFFNVTEPLAGDETMNIRTSTMAVGIRGTCGWVDVEDESLMCVYLLKGKVECSIFDGDGGVLASETITAGQAAKLVLDGDEASIITAEFDAGKLPAFVEDALENPEDWGLQSSAKDPDESRADTAPEDETGSAAGENGEIVRDIQVREEGGILYFSGTGIVSSEDYEGYTPVNVVVEEGITGIGDEAFIHCYYLVSLALPDGLVSIGDNAFRGCTALASVTLPDSLVSIGDYAFGGSELTTLTLPASLENIGEGAFSSNHSLASVTLPDGLKSIGRRAFYECSVLTSIALPASLENVDEEAFRFCHSLASVTLPDSLKSISDGMFLSCRSLASVTLPDGLKSIGKEAFSGCPLTSISFPDSLESIGERAFEACRLESIILPDGLKSIGDSAFWGEGTLLIILPDSIESIGKDVFANSYNLEKLVIKAPSRLRDTAASWFVDYESNEELFEWY